MAKSNTPSKPAANKKAPAKTAAPMAPKKAQPVVIDDTELELELDDETDEDDTQAELEAVAKKAPSKAPAAPKAKEAKLPAPEAKRTGTADANFKASVALVDKLALEGVTKLDGTTSRQKYSKGTLLLKVYPDPKGVVVKLYGGGTNTGKTRIDIPALEAVTQALFGKGGYEAAVALVSKGVAK